VIGKVHRLKLSSRGRTTAAAPRQKKVAAASTGATKSVARAPTVTRSITTSIGATALQAQFEAEPVVRYRPASDVVVPISRRLQLVQLSERTCKWPNGDPLSEDFSFCGAETGETGPYCTYHSRIAFQPAAERRRR